ncbi:DUF4190 domain-containing protein [Singulisphaera sp. PoT]|uniref:DUF4190 domain-containing protein n=1 Tax=Singulisphaera sp. PoT TaxID=3411797 RepID=UPI003BF5FB96
MAVEQNLTPSPETQYNSVIENEIPAYRAVSPQAVLSVLLGLLGLLSFTNWFFLIFSVAAVLFGVYAERRIRRDPEIWTGLRLAQIGTAMGMIFGLAAVTISLVQGVVRSYDASKFAREYAEVLKKGSVEEAVFNSVAPRMREGKTPVELYKDMKAQAKEPQAFEMHYTGLLSLKKVIEDDPATDIHFERLETHGVDGLDRFAAALVEVHSPKAKVEQYALLILKSSPSSGKPGWWVEETKFPYQPASYVPQAKAVDDGHGHAH